MARSLYGLSGGKSRKTRSVFKSLDYYNARCADSHPALPLPNSTHVIYGGSCISPVVLDADVYIGFDANMARTHRAYPWTKGHEFVFRIADMCAPTNADEFRKLVEWTKGRLEAGDKVHAGCIGGHGRTGMFLAALVSLYGEDDAITYVRDHYCNKAVESREQVAFLAKHYGVTAASGHKDVDWGAPVDVLHELPWGSPHYPITNAVIPTKDADKPVQKIRPVTGIGSMWDEP